MYSSKPKKVNCDVTLPEDEMYKGSEKINTRALRYHKMSNKIPTEKGGNYGPLPVEIITGKSIEEIMST